MERNHRIAKAYARSPIISINNGIHGFDGDTIGWSGFENPFADSQVVVTRDLLGNGIKLEVDEDGNIYGHLKEPRNVFLKETRRNKEEERFSCQSDELILRKGRLKFGVFERIFDMKKFLKYLNNELSKDRPEICHLEDLCFSVITFGKPETELLDSPVWIMVINVIALEMLHTNLKISEFSLT